MPRQLPDSETGCLQYPNERGIAGGFQPWTSKPRRILGGRDGLMVTVMTLALGLAEPRYAPTNLAHVAYQSHGSISMFGKPTITAMARAAASSNPQGLPTSLFGSSAYIANRDTNTLSARVETHAHRCKETLR